LQNRKQKKRETFLTLLCVVNSVDGPNQLKLTKLTCTTGGTMNIHVTSMKTQLSHLLSVADAVRILGEERVEYIVYQLLSLQQPFHPGPAHSPPPQLHQNNHNNNQRSPSSPPAPAAQPSRQALLDDARSLVQAMMYTANSTRSPTSSPTATFAAAAAAAASASNYTTTTPTGVRSYTATVVGADLQQTNNNSIPPPIRQAWKRFMSRPLLLDKLALLKFTVPTNAQPHTGPGGHMGLFDCLVYALQQKPTVSSGSSPSSSPTNSSSSIPSNSFQTNNNFNSTNGGVGAGPPLIAIPDVLIVLAICKSFEDLQHPPNCSGDNNDTDDDYAACDANTDERDKQTILLMAKWMFTLYDAYQKKGVIPRDTLHRFLSDVHGEDSYKTGPIRTLLDTFFTSTASAISSEQSPSLTSLTSREFSDRIAATMTYDLKAPNGKPSHVLLDWMAVLAMNMLPPETGVAESTTAYLQTIDQELKWLPQICNDFFLAENRLFEIKRRFHSLVEASSASATATIQGDPKLINASSNNNGGGDESLSESEVVNNGDLSSMSLSTLAASDTTPLKQLPKHTISKQAFLKAVCPPNDELLGHGGYLPQHVAVIVFSASTATRPGSQQDFWDLTHVLQFGGTAVRSSSDKADSTLIRYIATLFGNTSSSLSSSPLALNRPAMGKLLECLCDHWEFRQTADAPPRDDSGDVNSSFQESTKPKLRQSQSQSEASAATTNNNVDTAVEARLVNQQTAVALGLLPKNVDRTTTPTMNGGGATEATSHQKVSLGVLTDQLLKEAKSTSDTLTTDQLIAWHEAETDIPKDKRRLGPLIMELRLMASVLFGIPPKLASMEYSIISELQHRHKNRYPQTEASRRGPRGTVWYIIDDLWYRTWNGLVQKVSMSPEDGRDLREKSSSETTPRRLGRISNKSLLRENGSLALRGEIKWRLDYEIIPPLAWSALQAWYDGGPPIHRTVVPYVPSNTGSPHSRAVVRIRTENEIELYPLFVTVFMCDATSRGEARPFQQTVPVSRVSPVRMLQVQLCKGLDVDPKFGRLWVLESPQESTSMMASQGSKTPESAVSDWFLNLDSNIVEQKKIRGTWSAGDQGGVSNITLLLELKDEETGMWPRGVDGKEWAFREKKDPNASETGDGIVGLYNMGNTCYLNSSIQCLSHTPIFRDYFTSKCYLNDINTTNPLGHEGRLAQVSAVLINSLWKRFNQQQPHQPRRVTAPGSYLPVIAPALTPKTFKDSIGKFSDHFAGNEQHDAQELLSFLLGGLSEDLNRIVDKPYIEAPDSDGRPDSELADIWWLNHLKREMSIIVALFTGQYKSLLTCKMCKYESARFEPFSVLQLPLPEDDHISVSLILYPMQAGVETMKYSIRVHNDGTLNDVLLVLAKILHQDEEAASDNEDGEAAPKSQSTPVNVDESEKKRLQEICVRRSQNMAVVDMRDGYVFKIAPVSGGLNRCIRVCIR
jgi:hypothetical protein